jgi:hypothetical protein
MGVMGRAVQQPGDVADVDTTREGALVGRGRGDMLKTAARFEFDVQAAC